MINKPNLEDVVGIRETDYIQYFNKDQKHLFDSGIEYGRQMWNAAVEKCAEEAKVQKEKEMKHSSPKITEEISFCTFDGEEYGNFYTEYRVSKESILKNKINEKF